MCKDFLSGMNTHPHTEDQATCTYCFPKHLLVTCKDTLYSYLHLMLIYIEITIHHLMFLDSCGI